MKGKLVPHQVESQQLLQQTVPQLRIVDLVLQAQVSHQTNSLTHQRHFNFACVCVCVCECSYLEKLKSGQLVDVL